MGIDHPKKSYRSTSLLFDKQTDWTTTIPHFPVIITQIKVELIVTKNKFSSFNKVCHLQKKQSSKTRKHNSSFCITAIRKLVTKLFFLQKSPNFSLNSSADSFRAWPTKTCEKFTMSSSLCFLAHRKLWSRQLATFRYIIKEDHHKPIL